MKLRPAFLLLVLALTAADKPRAGGSIAGRVVLVKDGKSVARDDVYVYLQNVGSAKAALALPGQGLKREIRQKDETFVPHVLVVPVGTEVAFPNLDKQEHNVFSPTDPAFDLGRYNYTKKGKVHVFEDPDEFDIYCDVHRSMSAKVKVVDSAYIAPVKDGTFTFANVPAGTYKVVAWTSNSPEVKSDRVVVTDGATIQLGTELHLQLASRSGCHDRKDGSRYDKYSQCPPDD